MGESKAWHEDDSLWETMAPFIFSDGIMASALEEIGHLQELLQISPPAVILDLCCGVGRHSVELAKRGFAVTGVDRSAGYLDRAKIRAKKQNVTIEFIQDDMRRFRRDESFDGVINLLTSFGYFVDADDNRRVLVNVYHSLKPGGWFVLEIMGKENLARIFRARDWQETEGGVLFLQERKVTQDWSWMENRWILIKDGERKEFHVHHHLYSARELTTLLHECGFAQVNAYGSLAGTPYDHEAKRLVAVARK